MKDIEKNNEAFKAISLVSRRIAELEAESERIKAENAKLRELVDAWMGCGTRYHTMQGACPMFDSEAEDFCKAASLARELGIEVN